jgi:glyoxylase-like metal-dependent hydrolase (beta-lactamase superfamily II)/8-oxo-dGTP pyrophosphatase MutT (NUDIX family)
MSGYVVPADARPAASLLLLRDGDAGQGLEVLMLRRAERDGDPRSGACVFPGGVVDGRDHAAQAHQVGGDDAALSRRFGISGGALDYAIAALRETFEEVGLLLLDGPFDADAVAPWRQRLQQGSAGAADLAAALGRRWDLRGVAYYSHWLTPPGGPKRFDTRFFAVRAPAGQQAVADYGEALELMWLTPQAALSPERALKLLPVTRRTLQDLARFSTADAALAEAHARDTVRLTMPRVARSRSGARVVVLPDELPYAEVGRLDPAGHGQVLCELVAGQAVALSARVLRLTAPNPGVMTGPGTNTYFVGAGDAWAVIDPGPVDAGHLQAMLSTAPGRTTHILVTHTHQDHSPGALALAQATGAPLWGRVAAYPHGQDATFTPQHEPQHGERIAVAEGVTLRVIHTPGHASNHLCYLLEEEKLLFTGDHVMQGSTVVINPPDGDMAAYLRALRALQDEDLDWLAPGHGFLVAQPRAVLQGLVAHRLKREARVRQALQRRREAGIDELLPEVYADVPRGLHPVARRSLLAHLLKLQADGEAVMNGEVWRYGADAADAAESGLAG